MSAISGGSTASFIYDAFGRWMSKSIGSSVTQFLYDGMNPVQELNGATPPTPTANLLSGLNVDEYFTRTDVSGTMAFLSDALGSIVGLVNSAGAINTSYTYEPFGNVTASGAANANPYQFTGRENDGTGLYYYRARYYSPTYQRFIAQDPIGFAGGINLYAYAVDNPISFRDPFGTCDQPGQPPAPCSTLGGAGYAAVVTGTDFALGGLTGFETGGAIGTAVGMAIGAPEVTAPIGAGLGTIIGMDIGMYKAIGDVFEFCNWGPPPWPFGLVPVEF